MLVSGLLAPKKRDIIHFQTPSFLPSGIRCEFRHFLKRKALPKWLYRTIHTLVLLPVLPFYFLEKIIINLDEGFSWFLCAALKGISLSREYRPGTVYSTGGTASAHLAGLLVSKYASVPWIAEFQDPLVHEDWLGSKREYLFRSWLEKLICRKASAVIFLTEAAKENARKRTQLGNKGHVIYPGSAPEIFPKVIYKKGSAFHFAHFGSLAGSRNLEVFSKALYQILKSEPQFRKSIKVEIYGRCDGKTHNLIRDFEYRDVITYHGSVPRKESLSLMAASDCLLLIQNKQAFSSETIPSKVYEYFFAKRPILGLVYKNPELEQMLVDHGHWAVEADDAEGVLKGIKSVTSECYISNQESFPEPTWSIEKAVNRLVILAEGLPLEK